MITYYHEKPIVSDDDLETTERDKDFPLFEVQCDWCMESFEFMRAIDSDVDRIKEKIRKKGWVVCGQNCYHKGCHIALMADYKMSQDPNSNW